MDYSIIIRSSGENTTNGLYDFLVKHADDKDCIAIVKGSPFEYTLKKSIEKAIEFNKPKTLFIDADITPALIFFNMLNYASKNFPEDALVIEFRALDFLLKYPACRGLHFYKLEFLKRGLDLIPEYGKELRPETYLKNQICKFNDCITYRLNKPIALHDYFQNPYDVFAKSVVRSIRMDEKQQLYLSSESEQNNHGKFYSKIINAGVEYGLKIGASKINNNRESYREEFDRLFGDEYKKFKPKNQSAILINWTLLWGMYKWSFKGLYRFLFHKIRIYKF